MARCTWRFLGTEARMRYAGRITQWNDERGFGFIEPNGGGDPVFVHVSDLARRGRRPVIGDRVTYAVASGEADRPKAVNVAFEEKGVPQHPRTSPRRARSSSRRRSSLGAVLPAAAAVAIAFAAYSHRSRIADVYHPVSQEKKVEAAPAVSFSCDGRTRCNQMTSCGEAIYFLKHCPNTQMDGDGDGVPCEQQWCSNE